MPEELTNISAFQAEAAAFRAKSIEYSRSARAALLAQGSGGGVTNRKLAPSVFEAKEARWAQKAAQYLPKKTGAALVFMSDEQIRAAQELLRAAGKVMRVGVLSAMDEQVGRHGRKVFAEWPVDTRLSKAALGLSVEALSTGIRITLATGAPYAIYIKEARVFNEKGEQIGGGGKAKGLGFKRGYLKKEGDTYVFDATRYEADKKSGVVDKDRKPAKGRPFRDLLQKPAPSLAKATAQTAVKNILDGQNGS